ncbi:MAG: c-type cytochrome domain-containing protein [Kofleriaceae bacterium]
MHSHRDSQVMDRPAFAETSMFQLASSRLHPPHAQNVAVRARGPVSLLVRCVTPVVIALLAGGFAGAAGCTCEAERTACTRDGDCGNDQVCYIDDRCLPREVAEREGAPLGDECAVIGGEEIGCEGEEVCRLGYCRGAGTVIPDPGAGGACTEGTTANGAPLFGGLAEASADGATAVLLRWIAAADEDPSENLRYHIYQSTTPGDFDFSMPVATVVGVTEIQIANLTTDTTYYFVVRAQDETRQTECNTTERSVTPRELGSCISYVDNIKPILDGACLGCHSGANPPRNLHLDTLAGVMAGGLTGTEVVRCQAEASLIYLKISQDNPPVGVRMPQGGPYLSATQIETVRRWIDAGAPETCPSDPGVCSDAVAPTFAGLSTATLNGETSAELCWSAGTDNATAPAQLLYDVYQATTPGGEVFTSPPLTTSPAGATCLTVSGLTPSQETCWVVRARDGAGNRDGNTVERCVTPGAASCIDYATVIQPIFQAECIQCHAGASPPRNLHLDSYAGVIAGGQTGNEVIACQPATSLLFQKISMANPPIGVRMPADGPPYLTSAQIGAIEQWIAEGGRSSCSAPDPCSDAVPPTFGGVTTFTAVSPTAADVCWNAGSDNLTPPSGLIYDAYLANSPGAEVLTGAPRKSSAAGANCLRLEALSPASQQCVVVRARDGAGNRDGNTVERCLTMPAVPAGCVDYATMIQPLLDHNCTRCHAGDRPPQWLRLDSYDHVVAGSVRRNEVTACNAGASLLADKIGASPSVGKRMPFDGPPYLTPQQIAMVSQWINQGAQRTCSEAAACGDSTAPTFAGAASAVAIDKTTARVCWPQATDDVTPAASLRYDIYQGTTPGGQNYALPPQDSAVGQLCMDVRMGPGSTACFVVRARDLAGNRTSNRGEVCTTTPMDTCGVDYDALVQPILTARCTHCHRNDNAPRQLDLRTYGGALAGGVIRSEVKACNWNSSLLNTKTAASACGRRMPFDGPPWLAATERSLLKSWVESGARRTCSDAAPCADTTPPIFAGIVSATAPGPTSVEVCWARATDNLTLADSLVYEIYDGASATTINFNRAAPYAISDGRTCATITTPTAQPTCFAVRARDLAGNRDTNTVVRCATPAGACFEYANVVQPIFDGRCVHCHSGNNPPKGIRWDSYAHAVANDEVRPCNPGGSKLTRVAEDCEMPYDTTSGTCRACLSSTQTRLIRQWIGGGAEESCPWGGC